MNLTWEVAKKNYLRGVITKQELLNSAIRYIDNGNDTTDRYLRAVEVDAFYDTYFQKL